MKKLVRMADGTILVQMDQADVAVLEQLAVVVNSLRAVFSDSELEAPKKDPCKPAAAPGLVPPVDRTKKKLCKKCGVEKPLSEMVVNPSCRDGRRNLCNECERKRRHKQYEQKVGRKARVFNKVDTKVARGFAPRERDELDRPVENGRVLPVGSPDG